MSCYLKSVPPTAKLSLSEREPGRRNWFRIKCQKKNKTKPKKNPTMI